MAIWQSRTTLHTLDNIVMTAIYLNLIKHTFIPATLTQFVRAPKKPDSVNKLINEMHVVHALDCKTPWREYCRFQLDSHAVETVGMLLALLVGGRT